MVYIQCNPSCRIFDHTMNLKIVLFTRVKNFLVIAKLSQEQRGKRGYLRETIAEREEAVLRDR